MPWWQRLSDLAVVDNVLAQLTESRRTGEDIF
jgi:hypothetical protein